MNWEGVCHWLVLPLAQYPGVLQQLYQSVHLRRQVQRVSTWSQTSRGSSQQKFSSDSDAAHQRQRRSSDNKSDFSASHYHHLRWNG